MSVSKTKSFVKECIALLKGDDNEATAQKILRQADSAFKTQIASLTGDTISFEESVEDAKEVVRLARLNKGVTIGSDASSRNYYISNLLTAQNSLVEAEESLEAHLAKLTFLEEQAALLEE